MNRLRNERCLDNLNTSLCRVGWNRDQCVQRDVVKFGLVWTVANIRGVNFHKQGLAVLQKFVSYPQEGTVPWNGSLRAEYHLHLVTWISDSRSNTHKWLRSESWISSVISLITFILCSIEMYFNNIKCMPFKCTIGWVFF